MTPAIAQAMRANEEMWDEHRDASLARRDVAAALAVMTAQPTVAHLPAGTGGAGRAALERFFAEDFLPWLPADLEVSRVSRTVGRFGVVDEAMVSFSHDRPLPWLLPGVAPTRRRADVRAVTIASFERGRICSVRTLWDQATLLVQLGLVPAGDPGLAVSGPG